MKRKLAPIYAWLLLFCFLGGQVLVFVLPFLKAQDFYALMSVIGFAVSCILTPTIHELGHILFAKSQNMSIAYAKFFIFRFHRKKEKLAFSLASPFESEQTQALPNASGNMQKRVILYTVGGLIFSAIYLFIICAFCVAFFSAVPAISYFSLGVLPYAGYLFLLNVVPFEYASGKTDTAVALGLYNEKDAEKTMLSAMEIYGFLSEGKTYGEIDRDLFFNLPVLCEDEPIYAVMLDLRYRYALDVQDFDGAADALNRLAVSSEYLTENERKELAFELVFMNSINGDLERANNCFAIVEKEFEKEASLRIRAAYCILSEGKEKGLAMLDQAKNEPLSAIKGVEIFERKMLENMRKNLLSVQ